MSIPFSSSAAVAVAVAAGPAASPLAARSQAGLGRARSGPASVKCQRIDPLRLRAVNGATPYAPVADRSLWTPVTMPVIGDTNIRKDDTRLRIFSGTANPSLAQEIASYMGLELGKINIKRFADGEIYVQLQESVRGCDVFLVQPSCPPANENLMELLIMIDACRRASAKNITAVIPYFGYARADRKSQGRESIAAKLVANMITEAGANRVLVCDLHSSQAMGYFDIPVDHVYGQPVILDYLASKTICSNDLVVVSPDVGGVARARAFAKKLSDAPLAIVDKRRHGHNVAEVMNLIGDVRVPTIAIVAKQVRREMGRGRSPAPLLVFLAVVLAALPHLAESSGGRHHHGHGQHSHLQSRGHGGGESDEEQVPPTKEARRQWPCCDDCGGCTKSNPAQCRCMDAARGGCHPACRDCVRSALSVDPPVYHCMDRIPNFCQRRCNAAAAAAH